MSESIEGLHFRASVDFKQTFNNLPATVALQCHALIVQMIKNCLGVKKAGTGIADGADAEAELRTKATLLDAASDAVFVTTLDGCITYWNRGAERLYGWSVAEVLGKDERELLQAEYPAPYRHLMDLLLSEGHWEGEVTRHRKSGEPLTVSSRWRLLRDADGNPQSRMAINTDVTEAKIGDLS